MLRSCVGIDAGYEQRRIPGQNSCERLRCVANGSRNVGRRYLTRRRTTAVIAIGHDFRANLFNRLSQICRFEMVKQVAVWRWLFTKPKPWHLRLQIDTRFFLLTSRLELIQRIRCVTRICQRGQSCGASLRRIVSLQSWQQRLLLSPNRYLSSYSA